MILLKTINQDQDLNLKTNKLDTHRLLSKRPNKKNNPMPIDNEFKFVQARSTVEIHLPDQQVISGPRGQSVGRFLTILNDQTKYPIVGAIVNHQLRELTYPIVMDSSVKPVTMNDADGMRFYRRSLTFLLESAFQSLFPNAILTVDHSVVSGGFFCQVLTGFHYQQGN